MTKEILTLEDVRSKARERLKGICAVYRNCDGEATKLCEGQGYGRALGIGGIGAGFSFFNNYEALKKIRLKMHLIGEHFEPDANYEFFGKTLSMPIMGASTAGVHSFGGEEVISEREFCRSIVLGCKAAGTIGWRGDSVNYSLENSYGIDAIAEAGGLGVKIVKPREQKVIVNFFKKAEQAHCIAVGVDIDGCGSYAMTKHNKKVYRKSQEDILELVQATSLPVIIKGIMCIEDARAAKDAGASGIVISNHGGRVLDHTPGTAEILPKISKELGRDIRIFADGGIRTGYDVLKMLALGANAVLIGRDLIRAAVGGGIEGVKIHMDYLRETLIKGMKMTNCKRLRDVNRDILE